MILLVSAMEVEVRGIVRAARLEHALADRSLRLYQGSYRGIPLAVAVTGMGKDNAEGAMAKLRSLIQPSAIVSLGLGGALEESGSSGTLVVADRVISVSSEEGEVPSHPALLRCALEMVHQKGFNAIVAPCLTSPGLVPHSRDKAELGRRYGAAVVDMESLWVGRTAASLGVPFIALRAVFDPLRQDLHPLAQKEMGGGVSEQIRSALQYVLARPWEAMSLIRLARQAALAVGSLKRFALSFIPLVWQEVETPAPA